MLGIKLPASWRKRIGKWKIAWKKHGPTIKFIAGNVGLIGAGVAGCVATAKAVRVLDSAKDTIAAIRDIGPDCEYHMEDPRTGELIECTQAEAIAMVRKETAVKIFKLYIVPVGVGAGSVIIETSGFKDMLVRNAALGASLTAYKKALDTYKERAERFLTPEQVEKIENGEGEVTIIKGDEEETFNIPEPYSPIARVFDESCLGWQPNAEQNYWFLTKRRQEAQDRLERDGFIFLNDVYKMLGFPLTQAGQVLGWLKDSEEGDGYISFGLQENLEDETVRRFMNGRDKYIVLDFNVDGNIINELDVNPKTCKLMPKV